MSNKINAINKNITMEKQRLRRDRKSIMFKSIRHQKPREIGHKNWEIVLDPEICKIKEEYYKSI